MKARSAVAASIALAVAMPSSGSETIYNRYDAAGRLVQVSHGGPVSQGATATYQYDKADNRTNVTVSTSWTSRALRTGDFNGDGKSDILLRDDSSSSWPVAVVTDWLSNSAGGWADNWNNAAVGGPDLTWKIAAVGDFNGDGRSDILWRNDDGTITDWLSTTNGAFGANWANFNNNPGVIWQVAGTGDFNGDGKADVLLRADDGTVTNWLGTASGTFTYNWNNMHNNPGSMWRVAGTGDFNGDGRSDVLLRADDGTLTDWLGQTDGSFFYNWANFNARAGNEWHIVATGDFNGDGRSDILWRRDDGVLSEWQGTSTGAFTVTTLSWTPVTTWRIAEIGDFNGDGRDDILWRTNSGDLI